MTNQAPSPYELAADDILTVMHRHPEAFQEAAYELGLLREHLPTAQHQAWYAALASVYADNLKPHDTLLIDRSHNTLNLNWLNTRVALYDRSRTGGTFRANVKLVIRRGIQRQHAELYAASRNRLLEQDADYAVVASETIARLTDTPHIGIQHVTAEEHGGDFADYMQAEPTPIRQCGIEWIDTLTGGIPNGVWLIGGAYKSRKTTLALNIMLGLLISNPELSVAFLSKEMLQHQVVAQMVAMLGTVYLKRAAKLRLTDGLLSATNLLNARRQYQRWPEPYPQAVDYGIATYRRLQRRFRIYDSMPEHGGITDVASVERLVNHDISLYGGEVFFLDYLQLLAGTGNLYERTSESAQKLQQITKRNNVTFFTLAQLNEETIKDGNKSYSPGIKGGGDPAATADYMLTTHYKQGQHQDEDAVLPVTMKLSRHSRGGGNVRSSLRIHPASGLIVDATWI